MPIYKLDESGRFVPFDQAPFPDLEKVLEDWIEANPHLVLEGEELAFFARQPRTRYGKYPDLLGVDKTGAIVIVELKRGETPRDVVAQALEYAAWVDSLSPEELDEMARAYGQSHGLEVGGISDLYAQAFPAGLDEAGEEEGGVTERVTFNNRQRPVIVAERISDEIEQTLRYMRTRFGVDIHGVQFGLHRAGDNTIINTTTIVGRELPVSHAGPRQPREAESDDSIQARVKSEFMRTSVKGVEGWVARSGIDGLAIHHATSSGHYIRYLGVTWLYYYYASRWLYFVLYAPSDAEVDLLRSQLSEPDSVLTGESWRGSWRFHVATDGDLEAVKTLVSQRVERQQSAAGG